METQLLGPPTTADARRAARELAAAGASRVLLFGSVARGDANERSDIDLVAVFDDIDYSQRFVLRNRLATAAEDAAGHPVEVIVTDRPEWKRRTSAVSSSFEAGIAAGATVLIDRPAGSVRWDKEIGLPDNNPAEALGRLDEAAKALDLMVARLLPSDYEAQAFLEDDGSTERLRRGWRLIDVCSAGAMTVETALKALAALTGRPAPHKHRIDLLLPLTGDRADDARAALAALEHNTLEAGKPPYNDLSIWRQAGTYIADRPDIGSEAASRLAPRIARAAVELAAMAADEIAAEADADPAIGRMRQIAAEAADILDTRDLLTGDELNDRDPTSG